MRLLKLAGLPALALALSVGLAQPAEAQFNTAVATTDVQRLQDNIYDAARDIAQVRNRDPLLASQLERELDDARDEAIYLKVKLRENEPVARTMPTRSRSTPSSTSGSRRRPGSEREPALARSSAASLAA